MEGTLAERIELRNMHKHFIGRVELGTEICYEDYLVKMKYSGGIDGVNQELREAGVNLIIPESPEWLQEIKEEPSLPPPVPGDYREYKQLNGKDMILNDYRDRLFVEKISTSTSLVQVGFIDTNGEIHQGDGMDDYFEEEEFESVEAQLCEINGIRYAVVERDDAFFDVHEYDDSNTPTPSDKPIGIMDSTKSNVAFFDHYDPPPPPPGLSNEDSDSS